MAARFVYWMNVSLDLRIEHRSGEDGGGGWTSITPALHEEFNRRAAAFTSFVEGRTTYEIMERAWPAIREDASQPAHMREFGEIWTTKPKVLVSRTRTSAGHRTRVVCENAIDELRRLRAEGDGDVLVGGATLASQLLQAGLLDEVLLFTHPVVLGSGRPLFDGVDVPLHLDLLEQAAFDGGVTLHRYAVRRP